MRLVLCDRNLILCDALAAVLKGCGHEVLAIAASPAAALEAVAEHEPDGCLLELRFPGGQDGLAAARSILQHHPGTAVIILSGVSDPAITWDARRLGVAGFLHKDLNVGQIAQALDVIAAGGSAFGPRLPARPAARAPRRARPRYDLTPREREVLRRLVAGQSTGQMACEMNIAASTLRTYVKNLFTKLGTHSRLQAAALASSEGLHAEWPDGAHAIAGTSALALN